MLKVAILVKFNSAKSAVSIAPNCAALKAFTLAMLKANACAVVKDTICAVDSCAMALVDKAFKAVGANPEIWSVLKPATCVPVKAPKMLVLKRLRLLAVRPGI